jgi:hypothetical protein
VFRRFQNPLQQGTVVLPNAMQAPPVIRVQGIAPGSLEAQVLEQRFAPGISHFIRSQRQNQEIGGLQVVRNTARGEYLDVAYTRMHGIETVTITPKPAFFALVPKARPVQDIMLDGYIGVELGGVLETTGSVEFYLNGVSLGILPVTGDTAHIFQFGPNGVNIASEYETTVVPPMPEYGKGLRVVPPRPEVQPVFVNGNAYRYVGEDEFYNNYLDIGDYPGFYYSAIWFGRQYWDRDPTVSRVPDEAVNWTGPNILRAETRSITPWGDGFDDDYGSMWVTPFGEFFMRNPETFRVVTGSSWRYPPSGAEQSVLVNDKVIFFDGSFTGVGVLDEDFEYPEQSTIAAQWTINLQNNTPAEGPWMKLSVLEFLRDGGFA